MPRPKLRTDEEILEAAQRTLLTKGPSNFTLTDVAREAGLSRAALIHRFKDRRTLHLMVMRRSTEEVREYFAAAAFGEGLSEMWAMLRDLISGMGGGDGFAGYLLLEWNDVVDPELNAYARQRNEMVRQAIRDRLPATPHGPAETASLIQAVIQGACMQWLVEPEGRLDDFTVHQTRRFLRALYPGHAFD